MPQYLHMLDFVLVTLFPGLLVLIWPRLNMTLVIPIIAGLTIGYLANAYFTWVSQEYVFSEFEAKLARGEELTFDEQMYDGTGENAVALMFGWLPAMLSMIVVLPVKLLIHWLIRKRRTPPPTVDRRHPRPDDG